MVEQILEFAGIQSGQRGFERRAVAIRPLVEDVLAASQTLLDQAHIEVEVDIPEDLPAVRGDESALRRMFQNLIGNAVKYGAAGGWIGIRARAADGLVAVSVSDRGIGIAPSEHARIFEPFYRSADVTAARIQGAGLGLSLVRRIVEGHGGRVIVKSMPGEGSEFVVSLPSAIGETAETIQAAQESAEPAQSS
jgi:signal transduction histidine kinase